MLKLLDEDPKAAPLLLYGTSRKGDKTAELTETALKLGFTGVDTANFPASYNEALTGVGIAAALASGIKREDLFVSKPNCPSWPLLAPPQGVTQVLMPWL
jgi:diketogulonate reductase-like aldo/keto reductase